MGSVGMCWRRGSGGGGGGVACCSAVAAIAKIVMRGLSGLCVGHKCMCTSTASQFASQPKVPTSNGQQGTRTKYSMADYSMCTQAHAAWNTSTPAPWKCPLNKWTRPNCRGQSRNARGPGKLRETISTSYLGQPALVYTPPSPPADGLRDGPGPRTNSYSDRAFVVIAFILRSAPYQY